MRRDDLDRRRERHPSGERGTLSDREQRLVEHVRQRQADSESHEERKK